MGSSPTWSFPTFLNLHQLLNNCFFNFHPLPIRQCEKAHPSWAIVGMQGEDTWEHLWPVINHWTEDVTGNSQACKHGKDGLGVKETWIQSWQLSGNSDEILEANLGEPHFALLQNGIAVKIMYEIFSREFDPEQILKIHFPVIHWY